MFFDLKVFNTQLNHNLALHLNISYSKQQMARL